MFPFPRGRQPPAYTSMHMATYSYKYAHILKRKVPTGPQREMLAHLGRAGQSIRRERVSKCNLSRYILLWPPSITTTMEQSLEIGTESSLPRMRLRPPTSVWGCGVSVGSLSGCVGSLWGPCLLSGVFHWFAKRPTKTCSKAVCSTIDCTFTGSLPQCFLEVWFTLVLKDMKNHLPKNSALTIDCTHTGSLLLIFLVHKIAFKTHPVYNMTFVERMCPYFTVN
jgi:hypothetical protein